RYDSDHKLTPTNDIENFFDAEDKKLADDIEKIREVNFSTEYKKDSGRFKSGKINEKEKQTLSDREKGKKIKKPEVKKQEDSDQEEDNNEDVKKANQGKKHEQSDDDDDNDDESLLNVKKSKLESKKSGESSELDDADTYEYLSYQLYGNQKDTIHLMNGIYCDARELTSAIQASREMTHMARRLMVGVFKVEEILNCTFTGRRPTAAGADQVIGKKIDPLHPGAILAILKYSKVTAKSRKWPILRKKDLHTVITQKLGEMKRTYRKQKCQTC
ncbi:Putative BEN domain-containing protein B1, partial [Frankliniella fusca]